MKSVYTTQFKSYVAHTTNMRDHKRQTDTVTNMTVEDIKVHQNSNKYSDLRCYTYAEPFIFTHCY